MIYWMMAAAATVLVAGCQKEGESTVKKDEGAFRFEVAAKDFSARTALGEDGKTVTWVATDELGVCGVSGGVFSGNQKFTTSSENITPDGVSATFSGDPLVAGDYVAYYPYDAAKNGSLEFTLPETQTQQVDTRDHVGEHDVLVSDPVSVSDGQLSANLVFNRLHALLRLSVKLNGETSGVTVSKITLASNDGSAIFNRTTTCSVEDGKTVFTSSNPTNALSVEVTGSQELASDGMFHIWMLVPEVNYDGQIDVTVTTSMGTYTFTKPSANFVRGQSYYITSDLGEGLVLPVTVASVEDWNKAVAAVNAAGQPATFVITQDLTLPADVLFPTVPLTLSGSGTLTLTPAVPESATVAGDVTSNTALDPSQLNAEVTVPDHLTVACGLAVNNGIIRGTNLTLADGGSLAGPGRLSLSGTLTVASGASASVAANMVVGCNTLTNGGTLANNGALYYNAGTPGTVNSNSAVLTTGVSVTGPQLPYSGFDQWYESQVSYMGFMRGTGQFIGEKSGSNNVWASGNGSEKSSVGGIAVSGTNPTQPAESGKIHGGAGALKMISEHVTIVIVSKFAAGNVFLGSYDKTNTTGAEMTFGIPYTLRPLALTGYFDYTSGLIDYNNSQKVDNPSVQDQWDIYVALTTKAYSINTDDDSTYPQLETDDAVIAYGRITSPVSTNGYQKFRVELKYKNMVEVPTHILITASNSVDGAAFTGSTSSVLYLDDLQLEF